MDVDIIHERKIITKAKLCNAFFSKSKGLMFSRRLKKGRSFLLVGDAENRFIMSIHMLFVFFPIDVVFLNKNKKVVDIRTAYPFISYIIPNKNSKYVLEMNKGENTLKIGDKVIF